MSIQKTQRMMMTSRVHQLNAISTLLKTVLSNIVLRVSALAHAKFASRPLSTSREEASEADNLLLHMKDVQYKPWGEIRKAWTAATGQETGESALLDRYNRLKAVLVPTSNPNKRARFSRYDDSVSAPRFQARHQTTRSVSPEPILKSTTSNMPSLALHKLNRTTIRVSHSGSFAPVKLRSCTTISDLFNTVARICDLTQTSRRKTRTSLKATFPWVAKTEEGRTMLLNEGLEDSFEIFLETIDEAPCWETENGKCTVHIEVVYRNISGEPAGEASFGSWPASDKVYA